MERREREREEVGSGMVFASYYQEKDYIQTKVSKENLERLREFAASKGHDLHAKRGNVVGDAMTVDEAIDYLLEEVNF